MGKILEKLSDTHIQRGFFLFVVLFLFILIYQLNRIYPIVGEDWDYSFLWTMDGMNPERLHRVSDIFISQYNHYIIWGGRSIVHAIDQFLILLGTDWHDIINTFAYLLFVYLVYKIVNSRQKLSVSVFLLVALFLWFFLPDFPTLILWITYSAVYLWGTLITIAFMYPYYKYYRNPDDRGSIVFSLFMFIMGIFAGWTYENIALTLICFLILLLLTMKYLKIKIPQWMIFGLIGVVIGCAVLLLAPGNFKRASSAHGSDMSIIYTAMYRVWGLVKVYFRYMLLLSVLYSTILYFFIKRAEIKDKTKILLISLVFVISAHLGVVVMLASPIFPARSLFGLIAFMITAIGILFVNMPLSSLMIKLTNGSIVILLILFCFSYYDKYKYVEYLRDFWHSRELYVEEQKKQGIQDIVFTDSLIFRSDFTMYDFKEYPDGWPNFAYAKYYNVRSVRKE